jgi:hypothetical protein
VRQNPDAICYEPKQKEIYAFNHSGSPRPLIDVDGKASRRFALSGSAETGQADPRLGRVFVNIEDTDSNRRHRHCRAQGGRQLESRAGPSSPEPAWRIDTANAPLFVGGGRAP